MRPTPEDLREARLGARGERFPGLRGGLDRRDLARGAFGRALAFLIVVLGGGGRGEEDRKEEQRAEDAASRGRFHGAPER